MLSNDTDEDWLKKFRILRHLFESLVSKLEPFISPDPTSPNYRKLSAKKKTAIALYFLKDTGSLRMTANQFGVAVPTVSTVVYQVCDAISKNLFVFYAM